MKFAKNLTRLRKQANLSQDKLAEQLHITRQAISKWESGLSTPDLETLLALCEILNVTPNQLLLENDSESAGAHSDESSITDKTPAYFSVFMMLVFVCGAAILIFNFYSGHFEPQMTIFALCNMGLSAIYFLVMAMHSLFRRMKK